MEFQPLLDDETQYVTKINYQIIHDIEQVHRFYEMFVQHIPKEHNLLLFLAARKKYVKGIETIPCFQRRLIGSGIDLNQQIQEYEVPLGTYADKRGNSVPNQALVVYCAINPRNIRRGYHGFLTTVNHRLHQGVMDFDELHGMLVHSLGAKGSVTTPLYFELDVNKKDPKLLEQVLEDLSEQEEHVCTIETKNGYHIIYHFNHKPPRTKRILQKYELVSYNGSPQPPVPGTLQGGFPVRLIQ